MKKVSVTVAFLLALSGAALAHNRPVTAVGAVVTKQGVKVQAPVGSDVQVDVDGKNVDITVTDPESDVLTSVLPWNWKFWR